LIFFLNRNYPSLLADQSSQVCHATQQNLLIPSSHSVSLEQIMKLNKLGGQRQTSAGSLTKQYEEMCAQKSVTPNQQSSLLYLVGADKKAAAKEAANASGLLSRMIGHNSNISSMESNMLELILNELEQCVEDKESADRLRQMISQMHIYFNEKLNELQANRSKLVSEFDEVKSAEMACLTFFGLDTIQKVIWNLILFW
jgi:hypothetical protein